MTLQKLSNYRHKQNLGLIILLVAISLLLWSNVTKLALAFGDSPIVGQALPEFNHQNKQDWINSKPLLTKDLRGKVVLLDFWTYGCWNCYRSFPWLNGLEEQFKDQDFIIIGVHTPEFEHEKNRDNIVQKTKEFALHHPIMIDSDTSYWRAMSNRYWPAFYLIDKDGQVRHVFVGETHKGQKRAQVIEASIEALL